MTILHDTPIRLVHLTTVPDCLWFVAGQVGYMQDHGVDVRVMSSPGWRLQRFGAAERVPAEGIPMTRRMTPLRDLLAIWRLNRRFRQLRPHIVHAHTPKAGLLAMVAARLAGVPVRIYHTHGLRATTITGGRKRILLLSERIACSLATRVFSVSHSLRSLMIQLGLCAPGKIETPLNGTINGIDALFRFNPKRLSPDLRGQTRARFSIPSDAVVIGFIGRIARDKGWSELAQAWQELRARFPKLHLLVVGPLEQHDPVSAEVLELLERDQRVHFIGEDWDTPRLFTAMDLVVLPSYREGFPTVLLEAAAMEKPVVASRAIGCIDAVQHEATGLLVPVRDADLLTAALRRYIEDPQLRRQHGIAARRRVLAEFQPQPVWEAIRQRYLELLKEAGFNVPQQRAATRRAA